MGPWMRDNRREFFQKLPGGKKKVGRPVVMMIGWDTFICGKGLMQPS